MLTLYCLIILYNTGSSQAKFNIPESVCAGQSFNVENISTGGSTFYWNFCSGNLSNTPQGDNLGNIGNLNKPVYSSIIKDGTKYFAFITNLPDGSISRLDFGNSLSNTPVGLNLGNLGVLDHVEGIQIKKDNNSGNWYGLIACFSSNYLARISFGNSLLNTPTAENLGNIDNLMESTHTLYTFEENNNWYTIVGNYSTSRLTRLNFGNSLANTPHAVDLGNVGVLNGPVGFYPVQENGNWYLYVANQLSNTISRLDFGNSLTNKPTGVNLGNIGSALNAPRSIIIIRDCGTVFGFVVNELSNDVVRITFPNGLTSQPSGESLGNIATFAFPHHISQLFRDGDFIYSLVTNVNNNTLSRLTFKGCTNPSLPSSALKNPPSIKYDTPGTYNISLVVDEGLPTQTNYCKQILVGSPLISINPASLDICEGSSITLTASGANSYLWSPEIGLSNTSSAIVEASPSMTTTYTVQGTVLQGCSATKTVVVNVNQKPKVSLNSSSASICTGGSVNMTITGNADTYMWSPADGLSSTTAANVVANPTATTNYTVIGTNSFGCSEKASINLIVLPKPTISVFPNSPIICQNDSVILKAYGAIAYSWFPLESLTSISNGQVTSSPSETVKYTVTGTDNMGCTGNKDISVIINKKPTIDNIISKCEPNRKSYLINFKSSGDQITSKYGQSTIQNSLYTITNIPKNVSNTIHSTILLTGCKDSVVVLSPICIAAPIILPEAFSPNNDGVNDYFEIPGIEEYPNSELTIFTRSGQKVYSCKNYKNDWGGSFSATNKIKKELIPTGTYYYVLKLDSSARIFKRFVYIAY